jgi:CheY-like chemotaxis protein
MAINKVLWLEDHQNDFGAYMTKLFKASYAVDAVESAAEAVMKLRNDDYIAFIVDIKVPPGEDKEWIELDKKKQRENPEINSHLGLELLHALFNPYQTNIKLAPPIKIDPKKIIVLTVVLDKDREISALGIPSEQILHKSSSDSKTLLQMVQDIHKRNEERSDR